VSRDRIDPPSFSTWDKAVQKANAETAARAEEMGVEPMRGKLVAHAGVRRPDLWQTLLDVLGDLDGEAAERLAEALRDPARAEALVGALEVWETLDGDPVAEYRARHGIGDGKAVRVRLRAVREALDRLPDDYMATLIHDLTAAALEVEGRPGAPQGHEVGRAARKAARALADLRALVDRAEAAAPKAKARQPSRAKAARLGLAADLCRALGGHIDTAFWQAFDAVWWALDGDDPDMTAPPDMQATREHLKKLRERGDL
jgi:hypothetical protein